MSPSAEKITIGSYLLTRLHQLGIRQVHGVPGDYNLAFLDLVEDFKDTNNDPLHWVGNANELNAAYSADGYARVKNGIGAIITTFGVGELSALNGIAGSYSEHVGVVHVVGMPSTKAQNQRQLLHHTLGDGDYTTFQQMSAHVTIAQTTLTTNSLSSAAEKIDELLTICYQKSKPVYLGLPTDIVFQEISAEPLKTPLNTDIPENEPELEKEVIERIVDLYQKAKNPVILVDACTLRHRVRLEAQELIKKTGLPYAVAPMGKSAVDETLPGFLGVYVGSISLPNVKKVVEDADLIISVGELLSDFNSGSFSYHITPNSIKLHSDHTIIRQAIYENIGMQSLLPKLIGKLEPKPNQPKPPVHDSETISQEKANGDIIKQAWLWPRFSSWLKEGDVIVAETGTSSFGILETKFPPKSIFVSQILWGSIGYSVGATLGAALAAEEDKEVKRRTIMFCGDGSYQLTVQEVSTMLRRGLKPILFVLNNNGYTIERLIHGADREYNDIQMWQYHKTFEFFGAKEGTYRSEVVKTPAELDALLNDKDIQEPTKITLIEILMEDKMDAPRSLIAQAEKTGSANKE